MKKIKFLTLAGIIALSAVALSCKKNGTIKDSDLTISFQTEMNGNNHALKTSFRNSTDAYDLQYELFQFYLSDITLINSDGDSRLVSEIELFRFDDNGYSSLDFEVPKGKYTSIQFGLGVKKELNEADPSEYSETGHPLNITENTYWGWASMYRFVSAEGRYDADGDGDFEGLFVYHTGHEDAYQNVSISHTFEISKKEANTLSFAIDIFKILDASGTNVLVPDESSYHGGLDNFDLADRISKNLAGAITVSTE